MNQRENNFQAKKSLGQNFLHAPHIIGKMIHAARLNEKNDASNDVTVLEAGPGKGVLTEALLATGARVIAIEKDDRAIPFLNEKFASEIASGKLKLVHGDILEFDPVQAGLPCGKYVIVANIPYYITGEFMRKFLEASCGPTRMVLMVQKEVGKRIAAQTDKESILSISVKAYGEPKYVTTVAARHFRPVPNVDSAVILIDTISKSFFMNKSSSGADNDTRAGVEEMFFRVVKAGFAHKRKVLIKNLEVLFPKEELLKKWEELSLLPTVRAEDVPLATWKRIASLL